jgi:hypothetical protein
MKTFKQKSINDYAYPIIVVIVAMIIVAIIAVIVYQKRDKVEAQRTAKVIEINGPCTIVREGATIAAVADMPLYSGDTFYSGIDANARIMIDEDKFLYLDSATRINFTATGTPEETHTLIYVVSGSMLTEVKEKLADGESFDIVTPNTFMEIHGTKTITKVETNENGDVITSSAVIEGEVDHNTVQEKDGKTVIVRDSMTEGDAFSVKTEGGNVVGEDEIKKIAQTGTGSDGNPPVESTYDDSGAVKGDHQIDDKTLDDIEGVLERSEQEDNKAGINWKDSNGDGINDTLNNVDRLRSKDDTKVADAEEAAQLAAEEEAARLAAEEEAAKKAAEEEAAQQAAEEEAARKAAEEEAAKKAAEEEAARKAAEEAAEEAARQAAEEEAARLAAEEEARLAQQAEWDQREKERQEREAAENAAQQAASQSDPDIPPADQGDPVFGGTYTGYYSSDGLELFLDEEERYYYVEEGEKFIYEGDPLTAPPSDPSDPSTDPSSDPSSDPPSDP